MSLAKRQLVFLWITSNFSTRTPTTYSTEESGHLDLAQKFHRLMSNKQLITLVSGVQSNGSMHELKA